MNYEEEKIARLKEAALERVSGGANASRETVRQRLLELYRANRITLDEWDEATTMTYKGDEELERYLVHKAYQGGVWYELILFYYGLD